jgi:phage tail sheath protein FI
LDTCHAVLVAPRPIEAVATAVAAFVGLAPEGPVGRPRLVTSGSLYDLVFGGLWADSHLGFAVHDFFRHGGSHAVIVRTDPSLDLGNGQLRALRSLGARASSSQATVDPVSLIVVPPAADLPGGTWAGPAPDVRSESVAAAERIGALAVLDAPSEWTSAAAAIAGIGSSDFASLRRPNAALYFPRVEAVDPLTGSTRTMPASGAIAGVMARNDATRGIWTAPAGEEAGLDVAGLSVQVSPAEIDILNGLQVNTLRTVLDRHIVWGARTLADISVGDSDWKYVPVRRLALQVEHSLRRGLRWAAFEPNDQSLWAQVSDAVEEFLQRLFRRGALAGATPREAYFVRCGLGSSMTQADLDQGRIIVEVGIAPLRPAEYVIIRIGLWNRSRSPRE